MVSSAANGIPNEILGSKKRRRFVGVWTSLIAAQNSLPRRDPGPLRSVGAESRDGLADLLVLGRAP